tara:strand:+ start:196 stop:567 length:372 start_codon:yes stop_codon:yes gene_type:complete
MKFYFLLFFILNFLMSCSFDKVPKLDALSDVFSNKFEEKDIRPDDSIEYNCDKKKSFFLFYLNEGKSVWVILPDREFKLDQVSESQSIYTNDITTLEISSENTQIKNEKEILYDQCLEKKDST